MSRKQWKLEARFEEPYPGQHDAVVMDEDGKPVLLTGWEGLTWKLMKILDKMEAEKRLREGAWNDNIRTIVRAGEV